MSFPAPAIKATEILEAGPPPRSETCTCPNAVPWMLWWIVGVHLCWGVALLIRPEVVSGAVVLIGVDWIVSAGVSTAMLGGILVGVSCAAAAGLLLEHQLETRDGSGLWIMAALICPQYFVVLGAFFSDLSTLASGNVHGQDVQRWLLLCALAPVVWGALLHTASILERYALIWRRQR